MPVSRLASSDRQPTPTETQRLSLHFFVFPNPEKSCANHLQTIVVMLPPLSHEELAPIPSELQTDQQFNDALLDGQHDPHVILECKIPICEMQNGWDPAAQIADDLGIGIPQAFDDNESTLDYLLILKPTKQTPFARLVGVVRSTSVVNVPGGQIHLRCVGSGHRVRESGLCLQ